MSPFAACVAGQGEAVHCGEMGGASSQENLARSAEPIDGEASAHR